MARRFTSTLLTSLLVLAGWNAVGSLAQAGDNLEPNVYFHYPYTYFPHSYWPAMAPKYPEPVGAPYQRPPAYMALPAFKEPHWRYEYWEAQNYYRGSHFWLDQF